MRYYFINSNYYTHLQLTAVRKFIQQYHKRQEASSQQMIRPDVLIEVDEIVFVLEDDWMEVKLRANYEVIVTS